MRFTSLISSSSDGLAREVVDHFRAAAWDVTWMDGEWEDRLHAVRTGDASMAWICGLLHVMHSGGGLWPFEAIGSPRSDRAAWRGRPVYFGDVVVARDSRFHTFDDLTGSVFAYNEEASLSGYHMMLDHLGTGILDHFSSALRSGSHLRSLELVSGGAADCAIVDSMILDAEGPGSDSVRVVASVGPYPAPPIICHSSIADEARTVLASHPQFAPVTDENYAALRRSTVPS